MNTLDYVLLTVIVIGIGLGLYRGFLRELVGTLGLLLAAIAANWVSPYATATLGGVLGNETAAAIVAWIIVFILAMLLMRLVAKLMSSLLEAACLGWINRLCGALLGGIKYCLICALVISMLQLVCANIEGLSIGSQIKSSVIVPRLNALVGIVMPWASKHVFSPALKMLK